MNFENTTLILRKKLDITEQFDINNTAHIEILFKIKKVNINNDINIDLIKFI